MAGGNTRGSTDKGAIVLLCLFVLGCEIKGLNGQQLPISTLSGHDTVVRSICFGPEGETLVSAAINGTVTVWSVADLEALHSWSAHKAAVSSLDISADGSLLATSGFDKKVRVWRFPLIEKAASIDLPSSVWSVRFLNPDVILAGSGFDRRKSVPFPFQEVREVSGRLDRITVSTEATAQLRVFDGIVTSMSLSPQTGRLAVILSNGAVKVWETEQMVQVSDFVTDEAISCVAISPDGKLVATGRTVEETSLSQARTPETPTEIQLWDVEAGRIERTLLGHIAPLTAVEFSPDGKLVASASYDRTVRLWDVDTGAVSKTLVHLSSVRCVAFGPSGLIATGSSDGRIRIWRVD